MRVPRLYPRLQMRSAGIGRILSLGIAASALAACQLLSGVSGLTFDVTAPQDGAAGDATSDLDASVDAGSDGAAPAVLTIEIHQPELAQVTFAGSLNDVLVGTTSVCTGACTGTKSATVARGSVTIEPKPDVNSEVRFIAPAACRRPGATTGKCTFDFDGTQTVELDVVAHSYAFVRATKVLGNLTGSGLPGADAACTTDANDAGLPGTYVAWLSDSGTNAGDRLAGSRGFIRVDGKPFADSVASLKKGAIFYPLSLDQTGTRVGLDDRVFTGSIGSGKYGLYSCADWASSTTGFAGAGYAHASSGEWTNAAGLRGCNESAHIYCFRKGRDVPLTLASPPAVHRTAFVSTAFIPTGGRAELDARCQSEAEANALPAGTYRAWVATTDAAPQDAFSTSPNLGGWYRPDSLPVFADPQTVKDAAAVLDAPLTQLADQSFVTDFPRQTSVATGMTFFTDAAAVGLGFTCGDWTDTSSSSYGAAGNAAFADSRATYFGAALEPCNIARSVYCLQK